tara:strand:- start:1823 stop:2500 length:678 start_codon:yes stop_codon:yes gene_type:complete
MVVSSADANFTTFLPGCIDYAEQRIYRELDLLYTQVTTQSTGTILSSGVRDYTLPTTNGTYITVDNFNIITPVGTRSSAGTRTPVVPASRPFIDTVYPSGQTVTGVPEFYAMASNTQLILGPSPDAAYYVEVIGIQRPAALSSANSSTIITQYVPDLFMAASMVFATAYQRDFGAQSDDPRASVSWEAQYKTLFASAAVEQARAKFEAEGWTSQQPSPIATPPRV